MQNCSRIILFDGDCMLCNSFILYLLKKEIPCLYFCDLNSTVGHVYLSRYNLSLQNFTTLYYIDDKHLYSKSTAILKILSNINKKHKVVSLLLLAIPVFIRDSLYMIISKKRKLLISKTCYLPINNKYIIK